MLLGIDTENEVRNTMSNDAPPEDAQNHPIEVRSGFAPIVQAQEVIIKGGGAALITKRATLSNSFVALMLCRKAEMRDGSRVLLGTPQAAALEAALGLVFALVGRWSRRR
jgi:hypothetical protein